MIRNIIKDVEFLKKPSSNLSKEDLFIAEDLKDTLSFHRKNCVGMAANMIGYKKCTIIVSMGFINMIMHNPVMISRSGEYDTEEGCLSLTGTRPCKRYKEIEVRYQDENFVEKTQKFSGFTAQIIQHEMDHLEGIII